MDINALIEELKNFDSADFQNIGQAPFAVRLLLWIACFIAVLVAALVVLSEPKYSEIQALAVKEKDFRDKFVVESRQAANKDKYEAQLVEIQESFGVLLKKLPEQIEVDRLIGNINEAAKENNITIVQLSPSTKINKEFYFEFPLSIAFTGAYHDIGRFFNQLASLTQIITLHDITLSRLEVAGGLPVVKGEAIAKTYSYISEESRE